ncbi:SpaA isopeptide-forming pilin-related protein [Lacticaseibacillus yichunensis]|uniref:SpaA isopeptide-forming pilin-related protein n=1 Tax=Lacticaseibacillus yichunensis TaxID=2486015 RepID=A0ABW4CQX7_9LACO
MLTNRLRVFALTVVTFLLAISGSQGSAAQAATSAPSITIQKQVSAKSEAGTAQTTVPLAGARYHLVKVQALSSKQKIDPADASSYQVVGGTDALDQILVTDQQGTATISGPELTTGDYLLAELKGPGVPKPAAPIVFSLPYKMAGQLISDFVYTPKSGLVAPSEGGTKKQTLGGTIVGKVKDKKIMQTSGIVPAVGYSLLVLAAGVMAGSFVLLQLFKKRRAHSAGN